MKRVGIGDAGKRKPRRDRPAGVWKIDFITSGSLNQAFPRREGVKRGDGGGEDSSEAAKKPDATDHRKIFLSAVAERRPSRQVAPEPMRVTPLISSAAELSRAEAFQPSLRSITAAVLAVAATYVYFLIFAQFGFLQAVTTVDGGHLKQIMTVMGASGIAASVATAGWHRDSRWRLLLRSGFTLCGVAAGLTMLADNLGLLVVAAMLTGGGTGIITVTLAARLRRELGVARLGISLGAGTGLAYGLCNVPVIFNAGAFGQAVVAIAACAVGCLAVENFRQSAPWSVVAGADDSSFGVASWVAVFLALVWLDSAAFYIIQHTESLKAGAWGGAGQLYLNALVHLTAAVLAGLLLDRRLVGWTVILAVGLLMAACRLIGAGPGSLATGAFCYTAGVSLYSTALVYYPSFAGRVGIAALVYAVAGWIGSALGIGMAENLGRVPDWFLAAAGTVVAGASLFRQFSRQRIRPGVAGSCLLVILLLGLTGRVRAGEGVAAGRRVYLAEGCIHCHSQYVRPGTADIDRFGPARSLEALRAGQPPLLGNRRQGPDLLNVAWRHSRDWQRVHLIAPRTLLPGSRMPSYAHLFTGEAGAGEALLDYLESLRPAGPVENVQ